METSLAESQTDSYFHKVAKWLSKVKRCKLHTHSKTNYNKNKPWQKNRLGAVSEKFFTGGRGGGGGRGFNRFYVATILALIFAAV